MYNKVISESDNCKEILSSYFNGLSYEEILKEYAYASINTVRQRVFKCRTKLINLIKIRLHCYSAIQYTPSVGQIFFGR